jgi:NDP-sugar pyrophosphorylase family protein
MDGNGPVPSHIHTKGGGWVANTANVYDSAYIGPDARVYGNAWVSGNACVSGNARVHGDARVYGNARVYGDALIHGNARVYGNARVKRGVYTCTPTSITRSDGYMFTLQSDGSIVAGCRDFTPDEAKAHWGHAEHHKHRESMAIVTALNAIAAQRQ